MKYVKMLGLLAIAAAAMMAVPGIASATILTSPVNVKLENGEKIHAVSEGSTTLDGPVAITCKKSTVQGKITTSGGVATTVKGPIEELTFEECGTNDVKVVQKGELIVHTEYTKEANGEELEKTTNTGNGTLTSNGAEVTIEVTSLGISCIYTTSNTPIGILTGSKNTGGTATLDINSSAIPRTGHSVFCGGSAKWTGSYEVKIPDYLDVD